MKLTFASLKLRIACTALIVYRYYNTTEAASDEDGSNGELKDSSDNGDDDGERCE